MEFALRGTEVTIIGEPNIGFAQNNLVNSIAGNVDTEEGWEFTLSVFMTKIQKFNTIKMTRDGDIVYAQLTSDMMPVGGRYEVQFVMTKGDQVSHSDVFNFWVENSINLNAVWTPIPTEFRQIEENMRIMNQNPPVPGDNGKWMVYNPETGEYEQSNANLPQDYSSLPIASANTLGGVKIGEGINVTEDGTISVENTGGGGEPTSGITQEEADARYLQLAGGIMTGDLDMSGNDVTGVHSVIAEGSTNSGLLFESNGTIVGVVTGGTRSATFTANSIDAYEHRISRVGEPLSDTDAARKQDVDAVQTAVDTVSETVGGIIDGTELIPYLPDNGGTLTGPLNMGNNKITMGATPTETTDVTNKGYVDGVVKVVSDEVDGIIVGTTPITIPVATEAKIGGIKPGAGTAVSGDGTLTIIVPVPTAEDNGKLLVAENGTYVLKTLDEIQGTGG